jgi:hypothetical protein
VWEIAGAEFPPISPRTTSRLAGKMEPIAATDRRTPGPCIGASSQFARSLYCTGIIAAATSGSGGRDLAASWDDLRHPWDLALKVRKIGPTSAYLEPHAAAEGSGNAVGRAIDGYPEKIKARGEGGSSGPNSKPAPTANSATPPSATPKNSSSKWGPLPDNFVDVTLEESGRSYTIVGVQNKVLE